MLKRIVDKTLASCKGWGKLNATKKGDEGENIVKDLLRDHGYCLYSPVDPDLAHPFDIIAFDGKREQFYVEAKVKIRREWYPDTGLDYENFIYYDRLSKKHNIRCFIFFIDVSTRTIYGNYLDVLEEMRVIKGHGKSTVYPSTIPNKWDGKIIRYWPIDAMVHIADLTDEQIDKISGYKVNRNENNYKN